MALRSLQKESFIRGFKNEPFYGWRQGQARGYGHITSFACRPDGANTSKLNTTRTGKTCTNFYDMHINQCLTCTSFHNYTTPQLHFKLHFTPDSCYYYKDRLGQSNKQILRSDD